MDITSRAILLLPHGFLLHRNIFKINSVGVIYVDLAKAFDSLSQTFILMTVKHFGPGDAVVRCFEAQTAAQEDSKISYMAGCGHFPTKSDVNGLAAVR